MPENGASLRPGVLERRVLSIKWKKNQRVTYTSISCKKPTVTQHRGEVVPWLHPLRMVETGKLSLSLASARLCPHEES